MCKPRPLRHILQILAQTCPLLLTLVRAPSVAGSVVFLLRGSEHESRMSSFRSRVGPEESLSVMLELEDRLKEHIDKLEHLRLSALDLREHVSAASRLDLNDAVSDHLLWLNDLSEKTDTLHINTTAFVQTTLKPCVWSTGTQRRGIFLMNKAQSENSCSLLQTRRNNDDAASEMSCNW